MIYHSIFYVDNIFVLFSFPEISMFSKLLSCDLSFTNTNGKKIRMFFSDLQIIRDGRKITQMFTVNQFLVETFEQIFSFFTAWSCLHSSAQKLWDMVGLD